MGELVVDRERRDFCESGLERSLKKGAEALKEAGDWLRTIRNEKLWADEFESFEQYVQGVWNITPETAVRWITVSAVAEDLLELGHGLESLTIANAMVLSKIDDKETRGQVWSEARKVEMTPSAKLIEQVAALHLPIYRSIDRMTEDEQGEFLRKAEQDIENAARFARCIDGRTKLKAITRAVNRWIREYDEAFRVSDPVWAKRVEGLGNAVKVLMED